MCISRRAPDEHDENRANQVSEPDREGVGHPSPREMVRLQVWERLAEKSAAYEYTDVVSAFPPLHHFSPHGVWVGSFSRSIPSAKWRLLHSASVLTEGSAKATPPQVARAYLDLTFPDQLRAKQSQIEFWRPRRSQPMYTEVGKYNREMVYLDLKSAYWSIVKIIGWDVDYFPGMLVRRRGCDDFPFAHDKLARNSLVSLGLPSRGFYFHNGQVVMIKHSWKTNIGLWSAVQDVLHGVADDMIKRAGAVYVNTDGYIVPAEHEAIAREIAAEWGLPLGEKHRGRATVYGVGAYSIGGKVCPRLRRHAPSMSSVYPRFKDRLRRYMRFLSDRYS